MQITFNKQTKHFIILYILIIGLFVSLLCSIKKCSDWSDINYNNITALTDTIKYYKGRSEQLIAQKTLLIGDMSTLKQVNDSLYDIIKKDIGISNPDNVIYIKGDIIDNTVHDTLWLVNSKDSIINNIYNIKKNFDFSDQYRTLKGYTYYNINRDNNDNDNDNDNNNNNINYTDTIGTVITENGMTADFTIVQKDNNVYISSSNPYIKYNNIIGITNTKNTKYKFGLGPFIGYGVTYTNKQFKLSPSIGISLHYNLFSF